jgi:hypothetical protein
LLLKVDIEGAIHNLKDKEYSADKEEKGRGIVT